MNRIDTTELKKKQAQRGAFPITASVEFDQTEVVEAVKSLEDSQERLAELIGSKKEFDFELLYTQLETLNKSLELGERLESLKTAFEQGNAVETIQKGLDDILEAFTNFKPETKVLQSEDVFEVYKPADSEEDKDSQKYYGFLASDGRWMILREQGDKNKSWRYAFGTEKYSNAWTNRIRHDYGYFNQISK